MAFNTKELEIIRAGAESGKSKQEIQEALTRFRTGLGPVKTPVKKVSFLADATKDIAEGFAGAVESFRGGLATQEEAREQVATGEISGLAGTAKTIGGGLRAGAGVVGQGFLTVGKAILPQGVEEKIGEGVSSAASAVVGSDPVKRLAEKYESLSPEQKALVDGTLGIAEGLGTMFGLGPTLKTVRTGVSTGAKTAVQESISLGKSLFSKASKSADDLVDQAQTSIRALSGVKTPTQKAVVKLDEVNTKLDELIQQGKTTEARQLAEETASQLSIKEKWAGIRPDIKKRISGKEDLLKEYFDVAHSRNLNDTLPSVYEYGGNYARKATSEMERLLSETGGAIGGVRKKLGGIKATREAIEEINSVFTEELGRLNLRVTNGRVAQIPGSQSRLLSSGDLKVIQDLYNELKVTNQNPTLTNLIDIRTNFDGRINFGKAQREVSGSVDPLSRRLRKVIAGKAEQIVGKNATTDIKKYSDFMEAYQDIKSFTDRQAGGEYLLRLVLSGRGGEARQVISTIKETTGIDLLDHATMMQIANELIGNTAQKNLFRQEVTKAGLDAASLLRGDPTGAAATLFQKGLDKILNPEKIFLEAAK